MAEFNYRGRNNLGVLSQGKLDADTLDQAADLLLKRGIVPISIKPIKPAVSFMKYLNEHLLYKKVSTDEMTMFARQMHGLTKAAIPISSAILRLAETVRNPIFAEALQGVSRHLAGGQSLANSMMQYPRVFSSFMIKLVQVGEETGHLDQMFLEIVTFLELESSARKQTKAAFHYPAFVLIAAVAGMLIISFFVIPAFSKLYSGFHHALPLPTRIIFGFSQFLVGHIVIILIVVIGAAILGVHYFKQPAVQLWWGKYQLKLPIIGHLINKIILARFTRIYAIILRTDIPVAEGIELAANVGDNKYARQCILLMKDAIEHGANLTAAAASTTLFTPLVLQMLSVGEETGRPDDMLVQVSDFYEEEVKAAIDRLSEDVNILLLLSVAGVVLLLALGVFLPIWDMADFAKSN